MRTEQILLNAVTERHDAPAIIDHRGTTSYGDLLHLSNRVADSLHKAGVPRDSIVAISVLNAREFLAALFGILLARCVAIPISPQLPRPEQARVIADTKVSWTIFSRADSASTLPGDALEIVDLPYLAVRMESDSLQGVASRFPNAAVIRHTSGTTGRSKGVVISHLGVLERTETCEALLAVNKRDVVLAPLPLAYHFVASALSFVRAGATIIDCANLSPTQTLELGARHNATLMYGSPLQYELLSRAVPTLSLPSLRLAISTSAILPSTTANLFTARFGIRLTQVYGVIEVGLPLWNLSPSDAPSLLGRCMPPYEMDVVDNAGASVAPGQTGELIVRGPGLFEGYLCGDEGNSIRGRDDWFHTGDLVSADENETVTYQGRKKSVINCAGNKIFPEEVESVLRLAPDIREARVVAEPHALLGNLIVAEVITEPGSTHNVRAWRDLCFSQLSSYKVPKEFRVVQSLPITGSGKVSRHMAEPQEASA
jgi:acyl-CoA synthetase (AMP-forming)/AMP-acid ligase II